jgi:hypothetical protein
VATPLDALTGSEVHLRVPPLGFVPMANVTGADDDKTTLPRVSSSDTATVKLRPAAALGGGWVVTTSWVAYCAGVAKLGSTTMKLRESYVWCGPVA